MDRAQKRFDDIQGWRWRTSGAKSQKRAAGCKNDDDVKKYLGRDVTGSSSSCRRRRRPFGSCGEWPGSSSTSPIRSPFQFTWGRRRLLFFARFLTIKKSFQSCCSCTNGAINGPTFPAPFLNDTRMKISLASAQAFYLYLKQKSNNLAGVVWLFLQERVWAIFDLTVFPVSRFFLPELDWIASKWIHSSVSSPLHFFFSLNPLGIKSHSVMTPSRLTSLDDSL